MNFQLTEEQQMLKKMVRDFAEKEVAPTAARAFELKNWPTMAASAILYNCCNNCPKSTGPAKESSILVIGPEVILALSIAAVLSIAILPLINILSIL